MSSAQWIEVARAVGLTVASLEPLALRGARHGASVVVKTATLSAPGTRASEPTHLSAVAEIDPPPFAGIYFFTTDLVRFFGVLHGAAPTGHPAVDAVSIAKAYDVARVGHMLVAHGQPHRVGFDMAEAASSVSLVVKDRTVEALVSGAHADEARVTFLVDVAARLARALAERAIDVPQRPEENEARLRWHDVAATLGLSFDARRWRIYGRLDDVEVGVALEGSPPAVSTTFRARFRHPLACGMHLRRGFRESVGFATWQDGKPTGFPDLDGLVVFDASDQRRALSLLADPAVRAAIGAEARAGNIVMTDTDVTVGRGGFAGRTEITRRLEALRAIVERLTPRLPLAGPFR